MRKSNSSNEYLISIGQKYTLKRRTIDSETGIPNEWNLIGQGEFIDIETVQKQIDMISKSNLSVEVEFMTGKVLRNYRGEPDFELIKFKNQAK